MTTHKVLANTTGITKGLQTRGIDLANATGQVICMPCVREDVEAFHCTCYDEACRIVKQMNIEIKRPRVLGRQVHRQNADSGLSHEQLIQDYFRINVTIPFLDDVLGSLRFRFFGQENVMRGIMLLPPFTVSESDWDDTVDRFFYSYLGRRVTIVETAVAREMGRKVRSS